MFGSESSILHVGNQPCIKNLFSCHHEIVNYHELQDAEKFFSFIMKLFYHNLFYYFSSSCGLCILKLSKSREIIASYIYIIHRREHSFYFKKGIMTLRRAHTLMSNHVWYHCADFDTRFIMIKTLCMLLDYYVRYVSKNQPFNRMELVIVALG